MFFTLKISQTSRGALSAEHELELGRGHVHSFDQVCFAGGPRLHHMCSLEGGAHALTRDRARDTGKATRVAAFPVFLSL
jgi:hypothetical protein